MNKNIRSFQVIIFVTYRGKKLASDKYHDLYKKMTEELMFFVLNFTTSL